MKNLLAFVALLLTTNISYSQSLGASIGLLETNNFPKKGFGITAEYDKNLSNGFELTLVSSLLLNSDERWIEEVDYLLIPINLGARYYFLKSSVRPYVSFEGGISYFAIDQTETVFIDPNDHKKGTETRITSSNKILLGIGTSVGTLINLNKNFDININVKLYIGSDRDADFFMINSGILYKI